MKAYIGHLLGKLGLTDRVQLVVFAYEHELIRPGWEAATTDERRDPAERPIPPAQ